jgi:hypothetical protein
MNVFVPYRHAALFRLFCQPSNRPFSQAARPHSKVDDKERGYGLMCQRVLRLMMKI